MKFRHNTSCYLNVCDISAVGAADRLACVLMDVKSGKVLSKYKFLRYDKHFILIKSYCLWSNFKIRASSLGFFLEVVSPRIFWACLFAEGVNWTGISVSAELGHFRKHFCSLKHLNSILFKTIFSIKVYLLKYCT